MAPTITPQLLYDRLQDGDPIQVIDTRPAADFEEWHIPNSINVPFSSDEDVDELDGVIDDIETGDDLVTICAKGISSYAFATQLSERLERDVAIVQDGMEGWSRLYDVLAIPTASPDLEIYQFQRVAKGCLGYLICSVESHEAVAVDPGRYIEEFELVASDDDMAITHVVDTHIHADHISGGRRLADEMGATYHLPAAVADREVSYAFEPLEHTDIVAVNGMDVKAIHTPGHTTDSTSLLVNAEALLTGDTIFVDSVGRTELQFGEGDAAAGARELFESIHRSILILPEATTVLPGHQHVAEGHALMTDAGDAVTTTIRALRTELPLLGVDESTFIDRVTTSLPEKPGNYEQMMDINAGRIEITDEEDAIELELGPNRCAASAD